MKTKPLKEYLITWPNGDKDKVKGRTIFDAMVKAGYGYVKLDTFKWQTI